MFCFWDNCQVIDLPTEGSKDTISPLVPPSPSQKPTHTTYLYGAHHAAWLPVGHFISLLIRRCGKPSFCNGEISEISWQGSSTQCIYLQFCIVLLRIMKGKSSGRPGRTRFKLWKTLFVCVCYAVDPARNVETNSQHIPETQRERDPRDKQTWFG